MDIDDIEIYYTHSEEIESHFPYRSPSSPNHPKPRAPRCGPVIWIVKDGKPLEVGCGTVKEFFGEEAGHGN